MKFGKLIFAGAVIAAGVAFAADRTDPNAIERSDLMRKQGMNAGILGKMAKGETAYDAAAAEAAKAALIEASGQIEAVFMTQGGADPASKAKPEIWTNWEDFLVKAGALGTAAAALDVTSPETIGAGMGAIGGACVDCHKAYQIPG
jgi:cytochrome c556